MDIDCIVSNLYYLNESRKERETVTMDELQEILAKEEERYKNLSLKDKVKEKSMSLLINPLSSIYRAKKTLKNKFF